MHITSFSLPIFAAALAVVGCSTVPDEPIAPDEDLNLESEPNEYDDEAGKADSLASTSTFFSITPDMRKCMSPYCGGYFVERVNRLLTRCHDGHYDFDCYVAGLENATGLPDADWNELLAAPNLLRGEIVATDYEGIGTFGVLRVTEAWRGTADVEPWGWYYRLSDNGIRCFTTPCFSTHEAKLNSANSTELSGIFGPFGPDAGSHLGDEQIIVAGWNERHAKEKAVYVEQLFLKQEPAGSICAEYTTTDGRFYAKNFSAAEWAEAEAWVAADPEVFSSGIGPGTCLDCNAKPCEPADPPVCGLPAATDVASSFASLCEFRKVIREFAGTVDESKGKFVEGECQPLCATAIVPPPAVSAPAYFAKNFLHPDPADAWLAGFPEGASGEVRIGTCGAQPECVVGMFAPVCGTIAADPPASYDAPCIFYHAVMASAGADGESSGSYVSGQCP
jgi:hypothetical protein